MVNQIVLTYCFVGIVLFALNYAITEQPARTDPHLSTMLGWTVLVAVCLLAALVWPLLLLNVFRILFVLYSEGKHPQ